MHLSGVESRVVALRDKAVTLFIGFLFQELTETFANKTESHTKLKVTQNERQIMFLKTFPLTQTDYYDKLATLLNMV